MREYYVYIMASLSQTLYTGMTNDLQRRVYEHKRKETPGFSQRYNVTRLVYYESTNSVHVAIAREKQIKGWTRAKKMALIEAMNPTGMIWRLGGTLILRWRWWRMNKWAQGSRLSATIARPGWDTKFADKSVMLSGSAKIGN